MMMVWDALVAQTQANRDLVHLATGEAQLMQAAANRDTATALLTLVKVRQTLNNYLNGKVRLLCVVVVVRVPGLWSRFLEVYSVRVTLVWGPLLG